MPQPLLSLAFALAALTCAAPSWSAEPGPGSRRWWSHVVALAGDDMRGRDTGSPEHRRAQEYVVRHLARNGLRPAGSDGFFQRVPLKSLRLSADRSSAAIVRGDSVRDLRFLRDISIGAARGLPTAIEGPLVFLGSDNGEGLDLKGAVVVRFSRPRLVPGPPTPRAPEGVAAVIGIDSARGPEPSRWPVAYSMSMALADADLPAREGAPSFRFNPASAQALFEGSGRSVGELLAAFEAGGSTPSFILPGRLRVSLSLEEETLSSDNVIAVLPGSDPALSAEHVVLSAHIDGYGVGEPWGSDAIYNGAFDDAAYVATILDFLESLRERKTLLRRSLLVTIFTGEEKGLLGSRFFTRHLTVPRDALAANINLDQLRPVFPLRTLTMHAVGDTTLGDAARTVAEALGITIQADPEPLRNLVRRSDNFPFMQIGVPATGFVFGYAPGSADEAAYRNWYEDRYHTPLDDLTQPWVPEAAEKFNLFFARLVERVSNADARPAWKPGSPFAPKE